MTKKKAVTKKSVKKAVKKAGRARGIVLIRKSKAATVPAPKFKTGEAVIYTVKESRGEVASRVRGWPKWEAEANQWRYDLLWQHDGDAIRYNVPELALAKTAA